MMISELNGKRIKQEKEYIYILTTFKYRNKTISCVLA